MTNESGLTICPDCGMGYVPDILEDVRYHKKYHDKMVNGVRARQSNSDHVIWQKDHYRITVVNHSSSMFQKKRAQEAGLVVLQDPAFSSAPYHSREELDDRNIHLFLLYHKSRIVGLLIVEKRSCICKCTWLQYENDKLEEVVSHPLIWTIGLAWILCTHRGLGLAQQLVNEAVSFLETNIQKIGWYTPFTDSGEAIVRRCCPYSFYIAK